MLHSIPQRATRLIFGHKFPKIRSLRRDFLFLQVFYFVLIKRIIGMMTSDWMVTGLVGVSNLFSVDYFGSHSFTGYRG